MSREPVRHAQVEAILAQLHRVNAEDMGAFRARLRNLRSLGVPDMPKRGSGRHATYSTNDIHELILALQLMEAGMAPVMIANYTVRMRPVLPKYCERALTDSDEEFILAISIGMFARGLQTVPIRLIRTPTTCRMLPLAGT